MARYSNIVLAKHILVALLNNYKMYENKEYMNIEIEKVIKYLNKALKEELVNG